MRTHPATPPSKTASFAQNSLNIFGKLEVPPPLRGDTHIARGWQPSHSHPTAIPQPSHSHPTGSIFASTSHPHSSHPPPPQRVPSVDTKPPSTVVASTPLRRPIVTLTAVVASPALSKAHDEIGSTSSAPSLTHFAMPLDVWAPSAAQCELWLWRVMQKEKNKAMITRLEDTLLAFVADDTQTQLPFPPRNAFHRKVCHAVAARFGLAHRLEEQRDHAPAPAETVRLVLIKTPHSAAPAERLADLAERPPPPEPTRPSPPNNAVTSVPPSPAADNPDQLPRATFLRRPRSADGTLSRMPLAASSPAASASVTALKNISEEDYQKARARIFKPPIVPQDRSAPTEEEAIAQDLARVAKVGPVAKGPVEGSTGFERRRNRRNSAMQSGPSTAATSDKSRKQPPAEPTNNPTRSTAPIADPAVSRPARDARNPQDYPVRPAPFPGGAAAAPYDTSVPDARHVPQPPYAPGDRTRNDLQDPDFDRCYDKWAVRRGPPPPPPQHVPIFSQLLYPYTVQTAPHLHPAGLHVRGVNAPPEQGQQSGLGQYQSIQLQHAHSGAVMFQHVAQGIGAMSSGLSSQHVGLNGRVADHIPYDMSRTDSLGASHPAHIAHHQHQSIPTQVARNPSPTYGLDSTVDFPPLP